MPTLIDLTGKPFGRLTAIRYIGNSFWECLCNCGSTHKANAYHLRIGAIVSCGCQGRENRLLATKARPIIPLADRFWSKVDKTSHAGGCWLWTAKRNQGGYGAVREAGPGSRFLSTHRLSFEMANGQIPKGLMVCHSCDNPPCVNPDHLFLGTAIDNIRDCIAKGRRFHQRSA